jgi:hypothetical protein
VFKTSMTADVKKRETAIVLKTSINISLMYCIVHYSGAKVSVVVSANVSLKKCCETVERFA